MDRDTVVRMAQHAIKQKNRRLVDAVLRQADLLGQPGSKVHQRDIRPGEQGIDHLAVASQPVPRAAVPRRTRQTRQGTGPPYRYSSLGHQTPHGVSTV